ncbi:AAA family ATPase [Desulfurivibrio dismutans]|uniref:AAA family ATPase n=1 Tax=Desulfurivibrio dismutans TaxID=1398908 RepID=UPI0023DCE473|nr:AAA family ATPase [Desulfurivibrio alkaliphilus]MDF1613659.1 AAA family ATPase [Desulfurivibrio alkaliphilus]
MTASTQQAALDFLAAGFSVIPVNADKTPRGRWQDYQGQPMTPETARQKFSNGARLAVVAGKVSGGLELLDFDDPKAFQPFLETLEQMAPGLADRLPRFQTPSGGYHLAYRCNDPVKGNQKLAVSSDKKQVRIETRGEGGYFLTAPSPGYTPLAGSLTDCPTLSADEVATLHRAAKAFDLRPAPDLTAKSDLLSSLPLTPPTTDNPGDIYNRNHSAAELLAAHGWKPGDRTTAGEAWTRPGKGEGCSGVLLDKTGNFYCWSSNAGPLEPERSYTAFGLFTAYEHGGDFRAAARALANETRATETAGSNKETGPRFKLLTGADLEALPPVEWVIKGVLPSRGLGQTFGPSKEGKSFLVWDMVCHVAEGRDWFGYRVKQRPVVYLALEGEAGFKLRAEAWKKANGRDSLPRDFFMVMQPFRINQPQDVADLATVSPKGAIVVIDTQACAAPDADENSGKDMGQIIDGAKTLAATIEGFALLIAHTGKDATKGARGHSSQLPALDASIEVKRRGQQRLWRADKVKEGLDGTEHPFSLEVVNLGIDDDGDPITSCAIKVDSRDSLKRAKIMTESQRQGVASFWCAAEKAPTLNDDGSFLGLHLEDWRPVFYEISTADNAPAKKMAFQRLRKALTADGMATAKNDLYRMTTPDAGLREREIEKAFSGDRDSGTAEHLPPAEHQADNGAEMDQGNIDFMTGEILENPVNTGINDEAEQRNTSGTLREHVPRV